MFRRTSNLVLFPRVDELTEEARVDVSKASAGLQGFRCSVSGCPALKSGDVWGFAGLDLLVFSGCGARKSCSKWCSLLMFMALPRWVFKRFAQVGKLSLYMRSSSWLSSKPRHHSHSPSQQQPSPGYLAAVVADEQGFKERVLRSLSVGSSVFTSSQQSVCS